MLTANGTQITKKGWMYDSYKMELLAGGWYCIFAWVVENSISFICNGISLDVMMQTIQVLKFSLVTAFTFAVLIILFCVSIRMCFGTFFHFFSSDKDPRKNVTISDFIVFFVLFLRSLNCSNLTREEQVDDVSITYIYSIYMC